MFSNQYMGTRLAARGTAQPSHTATYYSPTFSTRQPKSTSKPVNIRDRNFEEPEEVDYSFMNLPVRERRKLFLGSQGEEPPRLFPAGVQSMTIPRVKREQRSAAAWSDTRSEYGTRNESYDWEPPVTTAWTKPVGFKPNVPSGKKSSTETIILNAPSHTQQIFEPLQMKPAQYSRSASSVVVTPVPPSRFYPGQLQNTVGIATGPQSYSTTIRVHDPWASEPEVRVHPTTATRVYPSRRYSSVFPTQPPYHNRSVSDTATAKGGTYLGRISQPLRVNVYNSDVAVSRVSPVTRMDSTWGVSSPIYPAYPAHSDKSRAVFEERHRRGQSVQPVTLHAKPSQPSVQKEETYQYWRPLQAPKWIKPEPTQARGRYVAVKKPEVRPQSQQEPAGVSDF